jgi:PKD repeat protein
MRLIYLIMVFWAVGLFTHAQNIISGYEYWFNQDIASKVTGTASENPFELNTTIDVSHLPDGLNLFSLRFIDSDDRWSVINTKFIVKVPPTLRMHPGENKITSWQIWYNNDYASMVESDAGDQNIITIDQFKDISALQDGLNTVSLRFKDGENNWSSVLTKFVIKTPQKESSIGEENNIETCQIWFNSDFGSRQEQSVGLHTVVDFNELINTSELNNGLNTVSIRFLDSSGDWSSVLTKFFIKSQSDGSLFSDNAITAWQMWFNKDYETLTEKPLNGNKTFELIETVDAGNMPTGLNILNIRFKDSREQWSAVTSHFFIKRPETTISRANFITAYEYRMNNEEGEPIEGDETTGFHSVELEAPVNPLLLGLNLDMKTVPQGVYELVFRFKDTRGNWSSTTSHQVEKELLPYALFQSDETFFCSIGTVNFTNLSVDADSYEWDFGDGTISNEVNPFHTYTTPGQYTVSLKVSNALAEGKTHTLVLEQLINISESPVANFSYTADNLFVQFLPDESGHSAYNWSFGEESNSDSETPDHHFASDNEYEVCLQVTSDAGCVANYCQIIGVNTSFRINSEGYGEIVYPVPFGNELNVSLPQNHSWIKIMVVSENGQYMVSHPLSNNANEKLVITTGNWSTGTYIIVFMDNAGRQHNVKAIKMN